MPPLPNSAPERWGDEPLTVGSPERTLDEQQQPKTTGVALVAAKRDGDVLPGVAKNGNAIVVRKKTAIAFALTATLNRLSQVHSCIWITSLLLFQTLLTGCANVRLQGAGEVDKIGHTGNSIILLRIDKEHACRGWLEAQPLQELGGEKGFRVVFRLTSPLCRSISDP